MSPRKDDQSLICSNCKEKTTEIWFSEKGTPLCLICFSIERFEKVEESSAGTPRKTLNSNPVLRMCASLEQKLAPFEKKKRNKSGVSAQKGEKGEVKSEILDEQTDVEKEVRVEEQVEPPDPEVPKVKEETEEPVQDEDQNVKKSLRRKKKVGQTEVATQLKKPRVERAVKEKPVVVDPEAKSRRSVFKQKAFKAPPPRPSIFVSDIIYFKGTYFRKGDIVSLTDIGGGIFYAQIRGFMQDQYCEKSAAVTWLLPTEDAPPPEDGFDPDCYIFGPEEDLPRKLEYMTFVMHAPSDYFLDRSLPYPECPKRGHIYSRLISVVRHSALRNGEEKVPECIVDATVSCPSERQKQDVVSVKDETSTDAVTCEDRKKVDSEVVESENKRSSEAYHVENGASSVVVDGKDPMPLECSGEPAGSDSCDLISAENPVDTAECVTKLDEVQQALNAGK